MHLAWHEVLAPALRPNLNGWRLMEAPLAFYSERWFSSDGGLLTLFSPPNRSPTIKVKMNVTTPTCEADPREAGRNDWPYASLEREIRIRGKCGMNSRHEMTVSATIRTNFQYLVHNNYWQEQITLTRTDPTLPKKLLRLSPMHWDPKSGWWQLHHRNVHLRTM